MKIINKILNWIYHLFEKHWIFSLIVKGLVAIWFTLHGTAVGKFFKITSADGDMTSGGVCATVIVYLLFVIIVFSEVYYNKFGEKKELDALKAEIFILKEVEDGLQSVSASKIDTLRALVANHLSSSEPLPLIISKPQLQLSKITEKCMECFLKILNAKQTRFRYKDISYSLIYRFDKDWNIISPNGVELPSVIGTNCSTFDYMIKTGDMSKFINRKECGIQDGAYRETRRDKDCKDKGKPMGSIFCRNFKITHSKGTIAEAVLAISTYGGYFVPSDDDVEKKIFQSNIEECIFEKFEKQIKLELCLLWLEEHKKENTSNINGKYIFAGGKSNV